MEVFEALTGRRSIRRYNIVDVPDNLIEKLLDAARWAPSGGNTQPWKFIVIKEDISKKMLKAISPGLYGEPSVIVIACVDFSFRPEEDENVKILEMGAAIQNFLLAAHALGLGACWVYSTNWTGVKEVAGIPEESSIKPISLISIGYPAENPKPRPRRPFEVIAYREKLENPWSSSK